MLLFRVIQAPLGKSITVCFKPKVKSHIASISIAHLYIFLLKYTIHVIKIPFLYKPILIKIKNKIE